MKYDTPYGNKTGTLLKLSMDAHTREAKAHALIRDMAKMLEQHAPQDANHEGLEVCEMLVQARCWIEHRENQIEIAESP
jgi:hypothetical protein